MASMTVSKRRFDLTADWRFIAAAGIRTSPILDEADAYLYDEAGTGTQNILLDEIYYSNPARTKTLTFSKRRFDLTVDARD